jgi:hypothetical protein
MSGFELFQLIHQPVEFAVADLRIVEHVVAVLVAANLIAKGINVGLQVHALHSVNLLTTETRRNKFHFMLLQKQITETNVLENELGE